MSTQSLTFTNLLPSMIFRPKISSAQRPDRSPNHYPESSIRLKSLSIIVNLSAATLPSGERKFWKDTARPRFPWLPTAVETKAGWNPTPWILGQSPVRIKFSGSFLNLQTPEKAGLGPCCTGRSSDSNCGSLARLPFTNPSHSGLCLLSRFTPTVPFYVESYILAGKKIFITHQANSPLSPGRILVSIKCASKLLLTTPNGN